MPRVVPWAVALLSRTWRTTIIDEPPEMTDASGGLIALWHGQMMLPMAHYRGRGYHVLVSPSDDGTLIAATLCRFGYGVVRGSSSRGGARAVRQLLTDLRSGRIIVITPDGPRGPSHSVNPGCAWMASVASLPIFPLGLAADRSWRLRSWDRFTIPRPFARVTAVYGPTIRVPRQASPEELATVAGKLRAAMLAAERRALMELDAADALAEHDRMHGVGAPADDARARHGAS